ncbi:MAG: hypothetical protein K9M45_07575 [Kiritimatiellales bacterium]|nr:hypothetical protein [Kiritimatiellales bacterium]
MNIEKTAELVAKTLDRMAAICGEPVFDEWALVSLGAEGLSLIKYEGSRPDDFADSFTEDFAPLKAEFNALEPHHGSFAFSHEGAGTGFDAFICAGDHLFLLFNHTAKSTTEITQSQGWMKSQEVFAELYERFMQDPLEL